MSYKKTVGKNPSSTKRHKEPRVENTTDKGDVSGGSENKPTVVPQKDRPQKKNRGKKRAKA